MNPREIDARKREQGLRGSVPWPSSPLHSLLGLLPGKPTLSGGGAGESHSLTSSTWGMGTFPYKRVFPLLPGVGSVGVTEGFILLS